MSHPRTTAVLVLGREKGLALIESMPGVEGMLVEGNEAVTLSSGVQGRVALR